MGDSQHIFGAAGESAAVGFLSRKGLEVITSNFRVKGAEVDIIAMEGKTIIFVEVKYRRCKQALSFAVRPAQLRRLAGAAPEFFSLHPEFSGYDFRIDIILTSFHGVEDHIQNIYIQSD